MWMSPVRFLVLMAFHEMARSAGAAEDAPRRAGKKQHKLDKHTVESNIELGGRVAAFMETLYGREKAVDLLAKVACRASGSQPSPAADATVVDLTGADDPGCGGDNDAPAAPPSAAAPSKVTDARAAAPPSGDTTAAASAAEPAP